MFIVLSVTCFPANLFGFGAINKVKSSEICLKCNLVRVNLNGVNIKKDETKGSILCLQKHHGAKITPVVNKKGGR